MDERQRKQHSRQPVDPVLQRICTVFCKIYTGNGSQRIRIDAVTVQNEPQHGGITKHGNVAVQQADFVKNHLGPAFQAAAITTKIIIWDHNCDNPTYPITILNDATAKQYIDGSAFHLYNGSIGALTAVHNTHPDRNLYFTEQWTGANGTFEGDLNGTLKMWS
jgi:glucosylceramidase